MTKKKLGKLATRVAVAKDVITQVRLKRMQMIYGSYLVSNELHSKLGLFRHGKESSPSVIQKCFIETSACEVCAKGALFMAYVRRFDSVNKTEVEEMANGYSPTLSKVFGPLWREVEQVYEGVVSPRGIPALPSARITWLMRNIIASGGRSVYPKKK